MITDAILGALTWILTTTYSWLPSWSWALPTEWIAGLKDNLTRWNAWLPIAESLTVLNWASALLAAFLGFKAVKWLVERITDVIP